MIDTNIALAQVRDLRKQVQGIADTLDLLVAKLTPIKEVKVLKEFGESEVRDVPFLSKKLCCVEELKSLGGKVHNGHFMGQYLEQVKPYYESSHKDFRLMKCKECGTLYFYEFDEYVNFSGGDDDINCTYIVVSSEGEADGMYEKVKKGKHIRAFDGVVIYEDIAMCQLVG